MYSNDRERANYYIYDKLKKQTLVSLIYKKYFIIVRDKTTIDPRVQVKLSRHNKKTE